MMAFLAMLRDRWGGAEGYVRTMCSLTDADIEIIKANLVVEAEAIVDR